MSRRRRSQVQESAFTHFGRVLCREGIAAGGNTPKSFSKYLGTKVVIWELLQNLSTYYIVT